MKTETKCVVVEQVCEALIGTAIGIVLANNVFPKCNSNTEKVLVTLGAGAVSFAHGRNFAKSFYKYCDEVVGTDFGKIVDKF